MCAAACAFLQAPQGTAGRRCLLDWPSSPGRDSLVPPGELTQRLCRSPKRRTHSRDNGASRPVVLEGLREPVISGISWYGGPLGYKCQKKFQERPGIATTAVALMELRAEPGWDWTSGVQIPALSLRDSCPTTRCFTCSILHCLICKMGTVIVRTSWGCWGDSSVPCANLAKSELRKG